jgi:prevent-host-death family protein
LAALIKRATATHTPIIVTQKGYPTGVILDVELFTYLRSLAEAVDAEADEETDHAGDA